jgi:hypothetical protein
LWEVSSLWNERIFRIISYLEKAFIPYEVVNFVKPLHVFLLVGVLIMSLVSLGEYPYFHNQPSANNQSSVVDLTRLILSVNASSSSVLVNVTLLNLGGNITIITGSQSSVINPSQPYSREFTLIYKDHEQTVNVTFPAGPSISGECNLKPWYPVKMYIMNGIYTSANYTQGKGLFTYNPTEVMCPAIYVNVSKVILLHGTEGEAYIYPHLNQINGTVGEGYLNFRTSSIYDVEMFHLGYYGFQSLSFQGGWYTVVAVDFLGQVTTQSFYYPGP